MNAILTNEKLDSIRLDDTTIWVKLDFAVRDGDEVVIYDWKTGAQVVEDKIQLAVYGLYARDRWHIEPDHLKLYDIYLRNPLTKALTINEEGISRTTAFIKERLDAMRNCLDKIPFNTASIEQFPMTANQSTCRRCPFKEICHADSNASISSLTHSSTIMH